MIRVEFPEPDTPEWQRWVAKCSAEQLRVNRAVTDDEAVRFKPKVYGGFKEDVYLAADGPFHGKCAFCEELIRSNQHGDIEHFRPKAGVTDQDDVPIRLPSGAPHPGYYWLAYDWRNLLPSCQLCNQASVARSEGRRIGKWNRFPIKDENSRAIAPGQEVDEHPLLINPSQEDPTVHIGVDETGVMYAKDDSARGKMCIDIFGLNDRSDLVNRRRQTYEDVKNLFLTYVIALFNANFGAAADIKSRLARIEGGTEEFSAAAREGLRKTREALGPALEPILNAELVGVKQPQRTLQS